MTRSISIIIPAYNEQVRLPDTLRRVAEYLRTSEWSFQEILIVDDGSRDGTAAAAEVFAKSEPGARVLRNPGNRGKGYSVRHGMLEARGEWRLFSDADLSTPIEELEKLWNVVAKGKDPVAIGSRAVDRSLIGVHQPGHRETMGRLFNGVMRAATGLAISDTQCGFKLFRADVAQEVFSRQLLERFGFDAEVLYIADRRGYGIAEVPVRWNHVDGSKVGMMTGLRAFEELLEIRLNSLRGEVSLMAAEFIHKFVPGRLPVTVLLLHGSGGDENDLLPVARAIAPGAAFLSPRGRVSERGLVRFFALDKSDVKERAAELAEWIAEAAAKYEIDRMRLFALGYSNGANMAGALMLLHPGTIAGACLLRARKTVEPEMLPALAGAPVLISAGQHDELIPPEGAQELAELLTDAGARVDLAVQNAGHDLTPADFSLAKQWFSRVMAVLN